MVQDWIFISSQDTDVWKPLMWSPHMKSFLNSIICKEKHHTFEGLCKPEVECSTARPWAESFLKFKQVPTSSTFILRTPISLQNKKSFARHFLPLFYISSLTFWWLFIDLSLNFHRLMSFPSNYGWLSWLCLATSLCFLQCPAHDLCSVEIYEFVDLGATQVSVQLRG